MREKPVVSMQGEFYRAMREYCIRTQASVTSFGRTPAHNRALPGASPQSLHQYWLAADLVYDVMPPEEIARVEAGLLGLWLLREGDHDHIESIRGRRFFGLPA